MSGVLVRAVLFGILPGIASAQAQQGLSPADLQFMQDAARAGVLEVRHGQLALQRASSQAVKALAQRMFDNATRSNRELAEIAQRKGVLLPNDSDIPQVGRPIDQTTGVEFDRLFPDVAISEHQLAIGIFERAVSQSTDLDVKNWAAKNLLTLRTHLADAKALPK